MKIFCEKFREILETKAPFFSKSVSFHAFNFAKKGLYRNFFLAKNL